MDFTLYRSVGTMNRVALGNLSTSEFYAASKDDDGTIHLKPVNIVDGARPRNTAAVQGTLDDVDGDDDA